MKTRNLLLGILIMAASSSFMSCSSGRCPMSFAASYKAQPVVKSMNVDQCTATATEKITISATN